MILDRLTLLSGKLAKSWIEDTVNKLGQMITGNTGIVLQDGGTLIQGFVKDLSPEKWDKVARELLRTDDLT